jgi:hypothetical protein
MAGVMYYELIIERRAVKAAHMKKEPMEEEVAEVILYYGIPSTLAVLVGGWCLIRKALAPLDTLTRAAERIDVVMTVSGIFRDLFTPTMSLLDKAVRRVAARPPTWTTGLMRRGGWPLARRVGRG